MLIFNKFNRHMRGIRSDRGTEYVNRQMMKYLEKLGIGHEMSAPGTPKERRSARTGQSLRRCARSILYAREVPLFLWAETASTAVHVLNRTTC